MKTEDETLGAELRRLGAAITELRRAIRAELPSWLKWVLKK